MTETGTATAPAADAAPPQAGMTEPAQAATATPPAGGEQGGDGDQPFTLENARQLRNENQSLRTRLKSYEAAEKAKSDAEKSDLQKALDRIAELERDNAAHVVARQGWEVQAAAQAAARKVGFWDPDLAFALLDQASIEYAEDGKPKNVEALVAAIAKAKPRLVNGTADYGGGPRGAPAAGDVDMNERIRRAARRG